MIVGGLGLFVLFILQFLFRSMGEDINLVGDNYYDKAQQYDSQMAMDKQTKAEAAGLLILFDESKNIVELQIPENITDYKGQIHFYRPSDYKMDFELEMTPGQLKYNVAHVDKGLWKLQLTLQAREKVYFKEKQIIIK